ncbi:hypothetical protein HDU82_000380 [Entophlyctis luteolus]|nr:hypothetical protein HDU82_000380 [Entophlyctis luteolus]
MVAVEEGLARASRPVFAARAVCYAAAAAVHVADPVSGAVLRSFRAPHSHIVSLARHQNLPSLLYSAHADAVVRLWDLSDASLLRTWNFASSIVGMVADPAHPDVFYLSFACEHAKDKKLSNKRNHIAQYILPPLAANPGAGDTPTPLAILIASNSAFVGISVSDQVVAACTDKNLWVWKNQKAQLSSTGFVK